MSTAQERKEMTKVQLDIELIKKDLGYLVKTVDSFNFASQKDLDKVDERLSAVEKTLENNKVGSTFANVLGNGTFTWVAGLIFAAIVFYIVRSGGKL